MCTKSTPTPTPCTKPESPEKEPSAIKKEPVKNASKEREAKGGEKQKGETRAVGTVVETVGVATTAMAEPMPEQHHPTEDVKGPRPLVLCTVGIQT